MFAYCGNNPISFADISGHIPVSCVDVNEFESWLPDMKKWVKNKIIDPVKDALLEKEAEEQMTYNDNGKNNGVKIEDSYKMRNPFNMYAYIESHRGEEISGSTVGVVYEWCVHNVAYYAGNALYSVGFTDAGNELMRSGEDLDTGGTIYDDDEHGILSVSMWVSYYAFSPFWAGYDLGAEISEGR